MIPKNPLNIKLNQYNHNFIYRNINVISHRKYTNLIYYTRYHNNNYYGFYLKRIKRKFN